MATKKQLKALGIVVNPYCRANRSGDKYLHANPKTNQAKPNFNPETLTRQQLRHMLRRKARKDVLEQYGRAGERNGLFVGYLGFSRRARRKVQHAISNRWLRQISQNLRGNKETSRSRGWIKELMQRMGVGKQNTLAASGFSR